MILVPRHTSSVMTNDTHEAISHLTPTKYKHQVPLNSVDPPDNTILEKSTRLKSMSDF